MWGGGSWSDSIRMTRVDFEEIAEAMYRRAGLREDRAVPPLYLAGELLGWNKLTEVAAPRSGVRLVEGRLLLEQGAPDRALGWRIAEVLARTELASRAILPTERAIATLAACLRQPLRAFSRVVDVIGPDFPTLADVFEVSETSIALRYGETTGIKLVLHAPDQPARVRGSTALVRNARVIRLTDDPARRVHLFAAA